MIKSLIPILVLSVITTAFSQNQKKYFDAPFGGGVGYVPGWYIPNINPINKELRNISVPELRTSGLYSSGGAGFIYIGFIKYLRVGGMGFGGSLSTTHNAEGVNREIVYSLGGGGLTFEYTLPMIKDIALSVGAAIGNGTLKIELYSSSEEFNWNGTWENFNSGNNNSFSRTLENNFWMITPTINLDIPLNRFVSVRIGTGYQIAIFSDWTADNNQEIKNVPSDLNANSFFVQSGLFIGFFSF